MKHLWLVLLLTVACSSKKSDTPVTPDAPEPPVLTCADPAGPACGSTEECINQVCVPSVCLANTELCPDGEPCRMVCVPTSDPCTGVACPVGETCFDGTCAAGCFPASPCLDVICGENQFCQAGACVDIRPCELPCPTGNVCHARCEAPPCEGLSCGLCGAFPCAADELCINETCQPNPCSEVNCAQGSVCVNGACVDSCEGCECNPQETCIFGTCECEASCEGKLCGQDNGCGAPCTGCAIPTQICNPTTGECACNPSCTGKTCGQLNDCGDPCVTNNGCQGGTCVGNENGAACQCSAPGAEVCGDGDCCTAAQDCIDTNSDNLTDRCCGPAQICDEQPSGNDQCCGGSQTCVDNYGCCNNNRVCADTVGNCLCSSGIAINCTNGQVGDEFCCANAGQACEGPGAATACCPGGQTCFDGTDVDALHDTCCTAAGWCEDSKTCCGGAGAQCLSDTDGNAGNDACCTPSCTGKGCGEDNGCGQPCLVQTCEEGDVCVNSPKGPICEPTACTPSCNPCTEVCVSGSCYPKCPTVNPVTCSCDPIIS